MKTPALFAAALTLGIASPALAQLGSSPLGSGSTLGSPSTSMPGASSNNPSLPSPTLGGSPADSPLSGVPGNPLGGVPGNPLGRAPSSIPSGVGAGLNQNSTASGLSTPGAPITDAGRPAGAPLGGGDANPGTPN